MSAPGLRRCANHRQAYAGWQCTLCNKTLCEKCTATEFQQYFCCACETPAKRFTRPRSERSFLWIFLDGAILPFWHGFSGTATLAVLLSIISLAMANIDTPDPFRMPWKPPTAGADGGTEALAPGAEPLDKELAAMSEKAMSDSEPGQPKSRVRVLSPEMVKQIRILAAIISLLLIVRFAFWIASAAAWGGEQSFFSNLKRWLQATAASFIVWGPGIAYLFFVHRGPPDLSLQNDKLAWLYAGLALAYLPMCVTTTASGIGWSVFNPFRVFDWIWRTKLRYFVTMIAVSALCLAGWAAIGPFNAALQRGISSTVVRTLLVHFIVCVVIAAIAHVVGALAFVYGYLFDGTPQERFSDPILPVEAEGVLKKWAQQRLALDARIRENAEAKEGSGDKGRIQQVAARKIRTLLQSNQGAQAFKMYQEVGDWLPNLLKDEDLIALAQAADKAQKRDVAAAMLEPLCGKTDFNGAKARLAMIQVLGSSPDTVQRAIEMCESVLKDFPKTDFSRRAELKRDQLRAEMT